MLLFWAAVALLPVVAGLVMGGIHAGSDCTINDDDTAVTLFLVDFLVLPAAAATFGILAGWTTGRPNGRGWAFMWAASAAFLSLVWGFTAFWTILLTMTDAACY